MLYTNFIFSFILYVNTVLIIYWPYGATNYEKAANCLAQSDEESKSISYSFAMSPIWKVHTRELTTRQERESQMNFASPHFTTRNFKEQVLKLLTSSKKVKE